jgi:transposase-like protein
MSSSTELKPILCSNPKCRKVVGELETGKARFKCKSCGAYTTIELSQPAPRSGSSYQDRLNLRKK